jgi:phosphoribosylanthranilate isomerase
VSGFVKICGMTDARSVQAALEAGADAIGFVFAPSVRQVTPQEAAKLALPARGRALCVAVTQHPVEAKLQSIFELFKPDVLQTDAEDLAGIKPCRRDSYCQGAACCSKGRAVARERSLTGAPRARWRRDAS